MEDTNALADYLKAAELLATGSFAEQDKAVLDMRKLRAAMTTPDLIYAEQSRILQDAKLREEKRRSQAWHQRVLTWARSL